MKNQFHTTGDVTFIALRRGGRRGTNFIYAMIDFADLSRANEYDGTWVAKWNPTAQTFYARANSGHGYLHRWILRVTDRSVQIDHDDHNGLNNRRGNLKIGCVMSNGFNRRGAERGSKSGRRNVYWNKREKQWMVWFVYMGKRYYAGYFKDVDRADDAAIRLRDAAKRGEIK